MKRKVSRMGPASLVVSLPSKWAKAHNINKGDEIEVDAEENRLVFNIKKEPEIKKIDVDVTELDRSSFLRLLIALYQIGYDEINIKFDKDECVDHKTNKKVKISDQIKRYLGRLFGLEIISQSPNNYLLKDISAGSEKEFENILRRIFFLIIEFQETITASFETKDYSELTKAFPRHDNIDKFINYCLRLLNKRRIQDPIEKNNLFHIITSLGDITDYIRYCCDDILKIEGKLNKTTIDIIKDIVAYFRKYYELFYKYETEKLSSITKLRFGIKAKIDRLKAAPRELILITRFGAILEIIQSLLIAKTALNNLKSD
jgi:phosphate uptake regulator